MSECILCENPIRFWEKKAVAGNKHLHCFQAAIKGMEFSKEFKENQVAKNE